MWLFKQEGHRHIIVFLLYNNNTRAANQSMDLGRTYPNRCLTINAKDVNSFKNQLD